jgi:hypothetical protein
MCACVSLLCIVRLITSRQLIPIFSLVSIPFSDEQSARVVIHCILKMVLIGGLCLAPSGVVSNCAWPVVSSRVTEASSLLSIPLVL